MDRTKPHPEPYRTAAGRLGVDPTACVAIEDSQTGVASALAAGCVVVAVPCEVAIAEQPGVVVVDTLELLSVDGLRALVAERVLTRARSRPAR